MGDYISNVLSTGHSERLNLPPGHSSASSPAAHRSPALKTSAPASCLFYKDWPLARLLKALFDSGIQIPPSTDHKALFLLYCSSTAAEPIFPPLKRRRAAPLSSPELLPAWCLFFISGDVHFPPSRSVASGSPASDSPPATAALAQHPTGHSRQFFRPTAPRSPPEPPAATSNTSFQDIFQMIKQFMQPFADSLYQPSTPTSTSSKPALPLPPTNATATTVADPDSAPVFSLASASISGPHPAPTARRYTISPALCWQIIEVKSSNPHLLKNLTLGEFVLAFSIFRDVLCTAYPHRWEEQDLYLAYVVESSVRYGSKMFFEYHKSFSAKAAAVLATDNVIVNWATPDNYNDNDSSSRTM
ncbi:UNVERIFIED_CONTAM: hypothetical protein FKN15_044996 [Acipenser sinensis]